jgi:site-specific DNA-methyltransferase (adenine-specific)
MARRPFKGSTIDNVLQHGVGALNIDVSRIPYEDQADLNTYINNIAGPLERSTATAGEGIGMHEGKTGFKVQRGRVKRPTGGADGLSRLEFGEREPIKYKDQKKVIRAGRDPRNRLKDLESQTTPADHNHEETPVYEANPQGRYPSNVLGEIADYQKYFYCPKVSRRERHTGFDNTTVGNNHPTVKPVALMRYLIQLVTPANSRVLDPFMGSGSTGMAAVELGHQFVGIDLDANYVAIADRRIQGWCAKNPIETKTKTETKSQSTFNKLFD